MTTGEELVRKYYPVLFMYITASPDGTLKHGGLSISLGNARLDAADGGTVYQLKYQLDRVEPIETWPTQPEPEEEGHA